MRTIRILQSTLLTVLRHLPFLAILLVGCNSAPPPLNGGEARREATSANPATIKGGSTGDPCGPPPENAQLTNTEGLDARLLEYVKGRGNVEALGAVPKDLRCDALMYRCCKICLATNPNVVDCANMMSDAYNSCAAQTGQSPSMASVANPRAPSEP